MDAREAEQGINHLFQSLRVATSAANVAVSSTLEVVKLFSNKDPISKAMKRIDKHGATSLIVVDEDELRNLTDRLSEKEIPFMVSNYGAKKAIIIPSVHEKVVLDTIEMERIAQESTFEISPGRMNRFEDKETAEVKDLDKVQTEILKRRLNEHKVHFYITESERGFNVVYRKAEEPAFERARRDACVDLSGKYGELAKQQVDFREKHYKDLMNTIKYDVPEKPFYVVDENGKTLKVDRDFLTYQVGDSKFEFRAPKNRRPNTTLESRDMSSFSKDVNNVLCSMKSPVQLDEEQYQEYLEAENQRDYVLQKQREEGRPVLSKQDMEELAKINRQRESIEEKLTQSHAVADPEPYSELNTEQSFFGFTEQERIDWETMHDKAEAVFEDGILLDDARAANRDLTPMDRDIDMEGDALSEEILDIDEYESGMEDVINDMERETEFEQEMSSDMEPLDPELD